MRRYHKGFGCVHDCDCICPSYTGICYCEKAPEKIIDSGISTLYKDCKQADQNKELLKTRFLEVVDSCYAHWNGDKIRVHFTDDLNTIIFGVQITKDKINKLRNFDNYFEGSFSCSPSVHVGYAFLV